jgi:hypothetical protein
MSVKKTSPSAANGQFTWPDTASVANAFSIAPQLISESTQFWGRRLHGYADWMSAMTQCMTPAQLIEAQTQFFARTQQDYAKESAMFATMIGRDLSGDSARE